MTGKIERARSLTGIAQALVGTLAPLRFGSPITHVYNPLEYAWKAHRQYLDRFGRGKPAALLLGMNPGPWGMAQTGVPFGEVDHAKTWLGIEADVSKPANEHPKRPIEGFACARSEVSGRRLWGWAKAAYGTPERFFETFFVYNYCPLVFMEESGRNFTPDKLKRAERDPLEAACDAALRRAVQVLDPRWVIGVGAFAEKRAKKALAGLDPAPSIGRILHPSPASPAANRGWQAQAVAQLAELGVG